MTWATIGRLTVSVLAFLVVMTILAIVELYWSGVYEFLVSWVVIVFFLYIFFPGKGK